MINLKEIRKSKNFTQQELASKLDIKQQQYQRYESGKNEISLKMFLKLLEVCHYRLKVEKTGEKEM